MTAALTAGAAACSSATANTTVNLRKSDTESLFVGKNRHFFSSSQPATDISGSHRNIVKSQQWEVIKEDSQGHIQVLGAGFKKYKS